MNPWDKSPNGWQDRRKNFVFRERRHPDGHTEFEATAGQTTSQSPDGCIHNHEFQVDQFHDCGHTAEVALRGRCSFLGCGSRVCIHCHARCQDCNRSLCHEHKKQFESDNDKMVVLCPECHEQQSSTKWFRNFLKMLFGWLIGFDEDQK